MPKRKLKTSPMKSKFVSVMGPITVDLEPEDFLDLVTERSLPVIQGIYMTGVIRKREVFVYIAVDNSLTYYTVSLEQLTEIPIAFIAENLSSNFWSALVSRAYTLASSKG